MIDKRPKPVTLIILDGWGIAPSSRANAITTAQTPFMDWLAKTFPHTRLQASGHFVGLPFKQPGNSEAGHLNLGAGRLVEDDAVFITKEIKNGRFFKNPAFIELVDHIKKRHSDVHLIGLITEENSAHSSPEHWYTMFDFLDRHGIGRIFLHLFTDGRDSPQHAAIEIIGQLRSRYKKRQNQNKNHLTEVQIATISGRFFAMDRTRSWERIEKVYQAMVLGQGLKAKTAEEAILSAYNRKETDEFITPTVIVKDGHPMATVKDNDAIVFMNLRSDRARELTKSFVQKEFNKKNHGSFRRVKWFSNLLFVALTDFGPDLDNVRTAYPARELPHTLPMVLKDLKQLYIAETEKYAHITFFLNGGYDKPVAGEEKMQIPSPKVAHYDLVPEMSAPKITEVVLERIKNNVDDFITINFANPDMLGHTGNFWAAVKGTEIVDKMTSQIVKAILRKRGTALVTADHGNADQMIDLKTGEILTSHTANPVPFILASDTYRNTKLKRGGALKNVAPTILQILGTKRPREMVREGLIV